MKSAPSSEKLRREVEEFLQAVQTDSGERRRSERIAVGDVTVTFRLPGAAAAKAVIRDISRTAIALPRRLDRCRS